MRNLIFSSVFVLLAGFLHGQSGAITPELITGTWTQYWIQDTTKYLAIPDSVKSGTSVSGVSSPITSTHEFLPDSTMMYSVDFIIEGIVKGTWSVRNDTLIQREENKPKEQYFKVRRIADGRIECTWYGVVERGGPVTKQYLFLEKKK